MSGLHAVIPSPTQGVWYLGPVPIRAYALCILLGILVAIRLGERRWLERGGRPGTILDLAAWAVPFGIVGGRLYHVITSWQPYFGAGGDPVRALYIWEGGLGIWGAVVLGGVGAWIGCRRAGLRTPVLGDVIAPGVVIAQAIGRLGNWFNNELYGRATDLPWGLRIYQWDTSRGHAVAGPDGQPVVLGTFHPTFAYEALWDLGVGGVLLAVDRRFKLGHGRLFALYVLLYTLGRGWIEALRVDPANRILGLRLNLWTSLLVGIGALVYLIVSDRLRPGRESTVYLDGAQDAGDADAAAPEGDHDAAQGSSAGSDDLAADGESRGEPADQSGKSAASVSAGNKEQLDGDAERGPSAAAENAD